MRKEMKKKRTEVNYKPMKSNTKMAINTYLSLVILNFSGLNGPIKIYRVAEWIKET